MPTSSEDFAFATGSLRDSASRLDADWVAPESLPAAFEIAQSLRADVLERLEVPAPPVDWTHDLPHLTMAAWLIEVTLTDAVFSDHGDRSPVVTTCLGLGINEPQWQQVDSAWIGYLQECVLLDENAALPEPDVTFLPAEQQPVLVAAFHAQVKARLG